MIFIALFLILLCGKVPADDGTDRVILEDSADLLTQSEASLLYTTAATLSKRTGWVIDLVTTDDADGKEAREYAEDFYMEHFRHDDGVTCLIDMDNREIYLATSGDAVYYVTDERLENILDDAYECVSEDDYDGTFRAMLEGLSRAYSAGIDSTHYTYDEDTGEIVYYKPRKSISLAEAGLSVILGLVSSLGMGGIISMNYRKKGKRPKFDAAANTRLNLRGKADTLVNKFTTTRRIPRNPPPSSGGHSGGHGSSVHIGSGGHSFGGGGRKF